ncbi:hypothetical protein M440DRAFT_1456765 [Trichoderma longibrachiatum ATCC 18648]|uniref:Uncharacterized protein n=1 Tax=Trichoderma longibrachiatum ATCC 18648 TaxID=983965 RepID=A0A2T4C6A4_TRILO|nr:hypothetical protein M440DRAFT_1456765 [Trichoderma longibrachiatum ATCC 18648]
MAAIRVGGPPWLKALVGRADETTATVELDLMSSNLETTEVWNGRDLARCIGRGAVREVLVLYHGKGLPKNAVKRVMSFSEALTKGYLDSSSDSPQSFWQKARALLPSAYVGQSNKDCETDNRKISNDQQNEVIFVVNNRTESPNISHNRCNNIWKEGLSCACLSVLCQVGVIMYAAFTAYSRDKGVIDTYAFPLFAAGTILLSCGIGASAYVVGSSTKK